MIWRSLVTTDGERVADVQTSSGIPLLIQTASDYVRSWRFERHEPVAFETAFTWGFRPEWKGPGCHFDPNLQVTLRLPTEVEVWADSSGHCLRLITERLVAKFVVPQVTGTVRCDCPEGMGIGGASVRLRNYSSNEIGTVWTKPDGSFRLDGVPAGQYELILEREDYDVRSTAKRAAPCLGVEAGNH